jgi:hypothetical protein
MSILIILAVIAIEFNSTKLYKVRGREMNIILQKLNSHLNRIYEENKCKI